MLNIKNENVIQIISVYYLTHNSMEIINANAVNNSEELDAECESDEEVDVFQFLSQCAELGDDDIKDICESTNDDSLFDDDEDISA